MSLNPEKMAQEALQALSAERIRVEGPVNPGAAMPLYRLRKPGESVEHYRIAMGWDKQAEQQAGPAKPDLCRYRMRIKGVRGPWTDWALCTEPQADEVRRQDSEQWEYEVQYLYARTKEDA